jgi:hypothetical protein
MGDTSKADDARSKHVEWCKVRAREYIKAGDLTQAVASMMSDMNKREDCRVNGTLGMVGLMAASSYDEREVSRFIEGFN